MSEELATERAAIFGEALDRPEDIQAAADLLARAKKRGKRLTDSALRELVRRVSGAERHVEQTMTLFGEEEMAQNLALEEAQISDHIRSRLAKEKRLFETVGRDTAAQRLGAEGT